MNFHSKDCQAEQLGAQHIFKMSRLGSATKEDIQDLNDQKDSLNTKKSVNHSVKVVLGRSTAGRKAAMLSLRSWIQRRSISIRVILC